MLSLPLITARDSHELWFGSSQPYRSSQHNQPAGNPQQGQPRRNGGHALYGRAHMSSAMTGNSLSSLMLEERALRARKNNIASFGYSWIKPAGCAKTMLGMKEEEAEREEALAAAAAEMAAAAAAADPGIEGMDGLGGSPNGQADGEGQDDTGMERDLDDDIPDADAEGLVEEGEEGLEEDDEVDEEGYMERDLDDDIPEAFPDDDDDDDEGLEEENAYDFDNQPDLDADIPRGDYEPGSEEMSEDMGHDLDDDIPEADEGHYEQEEEEWQHTDTDAEFDDEDDEISFAQDHFNQSLRASTTSSRGLPPAPAHRETEAQRRFLQRWSGGGDAFNSSNMVIDEDNLRASMTSQASRQSVFGRYPRRRTGGPRDSFD